MEKFETSMKLKKKKNHMVCEFQEFDRSILAHTLILLSLKQFNVLPAWSTDHVNGTW